MTVLLGQPQGTPFPPITSHCKLPCVKVILKNEKTSKLLPIFRPAFKKIGIEVNGAVNGMFITMTDANNTVLLFISGGPGVPEVWLNEAYADEYPNRIADYFTVCYWDYYGEGLSYSAAITTTQPP